MTNTMIYSDVMKDSDGNYRTYDLYQRADGTILYNSELRDTHIEGTENSIITVDELMDLIAAYAPDEVQDAYLGFVR